MKVTMRELRSTSATHCCGWRVSPELVSVPHCLKSGRVSSTTWDTLTGTLTNHSAVSEIINQSQRSININAYLILIMLVGTVTSIVGSLVTTRSL